MSAQGEGPLSGILVVSVEQAVAAPFATSRLADAGARVIKVERPEGDFARYYDRHADERPLRPVPALGEQSDAIRGSLGGDARGASV